MSAARSHVEKECRLDFDPATATVRFAGSLRLPGIPEYDRMKQFLEEAAREATPALTLDLSDLEFLNSAGITVFSLFVIALRNAGGPRLRLAASPRFAWQGKSLNNFTRLWNGVEVVAGS